MSGDRKIVVLGATGMLGSQLVRQLGRRGIAHTGVARAQIDLARVERIARYLGAARPGALINAAAFSDVNAAEQAEGRGQAFRLNRDAPRALARACRDLRVPLLTVSTDYVFDGRSDRPYREDDPPSPLQVYGRSKLEGEQAVIAEHPEALIARTSTLFGPGERKRLRYVDAILRQARGLASAGVLEVVELPVSSPTYASDLAEALLELLDHRASGIVHVVNDGHCSRLELARAAVAEAGLGARVEVRARPDPGTGPRRPAFSALDTSRFASITGRRLRNWREALRDYLKKYLKKGSDPESLRKGSDPEF